jgi:hypothetical protein
MLVIMFLNILLAKRAPRIPLVHKSFTKCNELRANITFLCRVFFIKRTAVLAKVLSDLFLLLLAQ